MRPYIVLVLAALALSSVPAVAAPESETKSVQPGDFAEKDLPLQQGQQVQWRIVLSPGDALAPYDIHSHPGDGTVETHQRGIINGTEGGLFTANATRTYSWLVTNALLRGTLTVTFETEVLGASASGNPLPGPEVLLVGLAALGAVLLVRPPRRARPTLAL